MTGHSTFWEADRRFVGGEPIDGGPGSAPSLDDQLPAELRLQDTKAFQMVASGVRRGEAACQEAGGARGAAGGPTLTAVRLSPSRYRCCPAPHGSGYQPGGGFGGGAFTPPNLAPANSARGSPNRRPLCTARWLEIDPCPPSTCTARRLRASRPCGPVSLDSAGRQDRWAVA
jgi:hypothetical protein